MALAAGVLALNLLEETIQQSDIDPFEMSLGASVPLMATLALCGFPSPSEDHRPATRT